MAFTPANSVRLATVAVAGAALVLPTQVTGPATAEDTPVTTEAAPTMAQKRAQAQRQKRAAARQRANRARSSLVRVALNQKGERYVAGASGPNAFDCSGFTMWVYKTALGRYLPHYSGAQMDKARRVSPRNLKPGDLLFYGAGGSQHVSMYIGKGKMIHATNPSSGVRVDSIRMGYYRARFAGAGRIVEG
ncbi:MAG: C40 family peptidase [Candidatus Nanopelagicales bacterium]|jgi:cell wall-associated NlpC family hydrolase|nr:C40 family peptidase [Candidatus Nanopelagicales bacterium]MCU0295554.1 C40 family peptidase [Candidatus Nanopelagicales bacterium]MCU0299522.1 C40 family peptidase [Candidatus Nanopelagicales bacterium]